jgi:4-aminobutyrate aminotransferase
MNSDTIRKKHKQYLFPAVKNFYKESVVIVDGKNAYVKDMDDNSLIFLAEY